MRIEFTVAALAAALAALPACGKSDAGGGVSASVAEVVGAEAVVEDHEGGSVAFSVGADGQVKALATTTDGKPVKEGVSGTLAWKNGAEVKTIPLAVDAKTGVLVAEGPKLKADITEVGYTLSVGGKPWSGTLHVPAGGTGELAADAKLAAEITVPEGKLGPHGGTIQVVGKDRLEIADEHGEVRVYVLDENLAPVAVGERKISVGVVADAPELVVLGPEPGGLFFTGRLHLHEDPFKLTIACRTGEHVNVVLVGWRPGAHLVVEGPAVVRVKVRVKGGWGGGEDVDTDGRVKVHGPDVDIKVKGAEGKLKIDVGGGPDVKINAHGGGKGKAKF